ncbi:hypothetical protein EWM64_g1884 [Hericium alpestre]|uniref:Uncharacterized protein n=1 Tax=Hericium alpestre TaxID=135208 RepID=A0A4Z0A543_9AGAM|nr:hypothetical protein EWM64_g1884 [Hericium alpestre]
MIKSIPSSLALAACLAGTVSAHITIWHPSIFGFNESTAPYRPQDPLIDLPFDQWWFVSAALFNFHGFLDKPPNPGDVFQLPAGGVAHTELACDKGLTSFYNTSAGGDVRDHNNPDYPCSGQPLSQFHTTGINDLGGCALAIAYESDPTKIQPVDFAVFSVNQTCVWTLHTDFQVPAAMPACPEGGCTCAWFWLHSSDSGAQQMYMTGFKCTVTGATSSTPIGKPQLARRCGADPASGIQNATPSNCTDGAKQPFYWYQKEGNTFFEGTYSPPKYGDLYNFKDGGQNDIFGDAPAASKRSQPLATPVVTRRRAEPLNGEHQARHAWGQHRRLADAAMSSMLNKTGKKLFAKHVQQYSPQDPYYEYYTDKRGRQKRRKRDVPPGLSKHDEKILRSVKRRAHYLDKGFTLCGMRFGWSFIIGIVPGAGDAADAALGYILIIRKARKADVPTWLVQRMLINLAIATSIGLVPIVGDVLLAVYRSNSRNAILLEEFLRVRGAQAMEDAHGNQVTAHDDTHPTASGHDADKINTSNSGAVELSSSSGEPKAIEENKAGDPERSASGNSKRGWGWRRNKDGKKDTRASRDSRFVEEDMERPPPKA